MCVQPVAVVVAAEVVALVGRREHLPAGRALVAAPAAAVTRSEPAPQSSRWQRPDGDEPRIE